ncbi:MAG: Rieske 2Fe-2S domain-containing protein, partial [Dehalococcoidia bacterium]
ELQNTRAAAGLVDWEKGLVDRRIFSDPAIYQMEMEQIFARTWNFVAHDSQIPNPGDFFMTFIGEDRVIVARDNDGNAQVLVNSCRHRGNAVCRAEEGHSSSFMCTYHGWTYDLKGALVGVPGFKEVYHEELDRESWGLITAAHVDTYKGFIFATMDPEAVPLIEFLGDVGRMAIAFIADRGDMRAVPGVQKYIIPCNWKLAVDNVWDYAHGMPTHSSAMMCGWSENRTGRGRSQGGAQRWLAPKIAMLGDYGHAFSGPVVPPGGGQLEGAFETGWRESERAIDALGPIGITFTGGHPNVFPNMWITQACQVSMRLPKGPSSTEIWWYTFVDANLTEEQAQKQIHRNSHHFGPAGLFEQDDGENWGESTRGASGAIIRNFPLNYSMGRRHGEVIDDELSPPRIEEPTNEYAQLWHYRSWADWMAAESWADLRQSHTPVPRDIV